MDNKTYRVICVDNTYLPTTEVGLEEHRSLTWVHGVGKSTYSLEVGKVYIAYHFTENDYFLSGHVPNWELLSIYPKRLFKTVGEIREKKLNDILLDK